MLSTCNRLEIYAELEDYEAGTEQIKSFLKNFRHGDVQHDMSSYMYTLLGSQATDHSSPSATARSRRPAPASPSSAPNSPPSFSAA